MIYPRRDIGDPRAQWHSVCGDCNTFFHSNSETTVRDCLRAHQDGRCRELQRINREHGLQPHEYQR